MSMDSKRSRGSHISEGARLKIDIHYDHKSLIEKDLDRELDGMKISKSVRQIRRQQHLFDNKYKAS